MQKVTVCRSVPIPYRVGNLVKALGCKYRVTAVNVSAEGRHTYRLSPCNDRLCADGQIAKDFYWHCDEWSHETLEPITDEGVPLPRNL